MRLRRPLLRARIAFLRVLPRSLLTRSAAAALRAASMDPARRAVLARNLRAILEPKERVRGTRSELRSDLDGHAPVSAT